MHSHTTRVYKNKMTLMIWLNANMSRTEVVNDVTSLSRVTLIHCSGEMSLIITIYHQDATKQLKKGNALFLNI